MIYGEGNTFTVSPVGKDIRIQQKCWRILMCSKETQLKVL